jgi:hypothetical protein
MTATTLPRKLFEFNRTLAESAFRASASAVGLIGQGAKSFLDTTNEAGRTVVGQTRSAVERTASTATTGAREVSGQVEAQGAKVARAASTESNRVVSRATRAVSDLPNQGTPYEQWTREQLYERAQQLDIDGRSGMSKKQLIAALRA